MFKFNRLNSPISSLNVFVNPNHAREVENGILINRKRLISKDGNLNFERLNIEERSRYFRDIFTSLLDFPWYRILILFSICFTLSWILFGIIWYIIMIIHGDFHTNILNGTDENFIPCISGIKTFSGALLYSIETQQTIGYGTRAVNENCTAGIILLIIQSIFGLIIQALWVGLVYTKLSRPRKRRRTLIWSRNCVISLRDGYLTLQCRLADMRCRSTLIESHIRMYFVSKRQTKENEIIPINLLDMNVGYDQGKDRLFFNWPIIIEHKIDCESPLFNINKENILNGKFEILLILEGTIEPTGMMIQTKTSYMPNEIIWGARFERMIHFNIDHYIVDYSKFNSIQKDNITKDFSAKQLQQENHI